MAVHHGRREDDPEGRRPPRVGSPIAIEGGALVEGTGILLSVGIDDRGSD